MKHTMIAASVAVAMFSGDAMAISSKDITVPEATYKTQEHFNKHVQGSLNDDRSMIKDLQKTSGEHSTRLTEVEEWTARQEGTFSAGLRDSVDRDEKLSKAIQEEQKAREGVNDRVDETRDWVGNVQTSAQTANDRATNLEGRANTVEQNLRDTNAQVEVTDKRSINNTKRIDGFETVNVEQSTYIQRNSDLINGYYHQTSQRMDYQQKQISSNTSRINKLEDDVDDLKGGVALGIATSSLQYDLSSTASTQFSVGGGYYDSHSAVAIGLGSRVNERTFINVNASSTNNGRMGAGAGVTFNLN